MEHQERKRDRPAERLHNLAHGLDALRLDAEAAYDLTRKPREELDDQRWNRLGRYVSAFLRTMHATVYEARNAVEELGGGSSSGSLRAEFRRMSPMDILDEMLPSYREKATGRSIAILSTDDSARTPGIELEIHSVRQMFHNALTNALKYSYKGSTERYRFISIRSSKHRLPESGGFKITVQNYGIGVKEQEREKIWEPWYRGELARSEAVLGSGLGLGQIRRCMQRHNGEAELDSVRIDSEGPYKTTLTLSFPQQNNVRSAF